MSFGFIVSPYLIPAAAAGNTAPTFVAAGTVDSSAVTANPGLPVGHTTNDILVIVAMAEDSPSPSITTPAGYTLIQSQTGGLSPFWRLAVYFKRDGGSETTPAVSGTFSACIARMMAFRGCLTPASPVDQSAKSSGSSSTALTFDAVTATVDNTMVVNCVGAPGPDSTSTAEYSAYSNANLASITEAIDNATTVDTGASIGAAYGVLVAIGSTGATTATAATNLTHGFVTFNLIGLPA